MPSAAGAVDAGAATIVARGLRNSVALTVLPGGRLVAGVNSRDHIDRGDPSLSDEALPHDALDWIEAGADYGWPYCYDENRPAPEYRAFDCGTKHLPTLLLPPHAAPLGLLAYGKEGLPGLAGTLLVTYHGYRKPGHRIAAATLDGKGPPRDVVWGWAAAEDHPPGKPVALARAADGSVLVTEDGNGTLLRLARAGR